MSAFLGFNSAVVPLGTSLSNIVGTFSTILSGYGWQVLRQSVVPTAMAGTFTTPANAFDGGATTYATTATLPQTISAQLTGGFTPTVMYLQCDNTNFGTYAPMNFTLDYSSNGSTWTTLQSWYGQTNWASCERRKFVVTGATSQVYWRINVLNAQIGPICWVGEWTLEDSTGRWLTNNVFFDAIPPVTETIGDTVSRECLRFNVPTAGTSLTIGGVQESKVAWPQMLGFHTSTAGAVTSGVSMNDNNAPTAGATASFATNVMTLVSAPTTGILTMGQWVTGASIPPGTVITSLLSGTMGVAGSTYTLSTAPGTIATEAIVTGFIATGGTASTATTTMTLQSAPTVGTLAIGQQVMLPGSAGISFIVALASGTMNAVGSTYTLSASLGATLATNSLVTQNSMYATGGSASFATNVMTVTVAPTSSFLMVGQTVVANGVAPDTTIMALASGTLNAVGSTYTLSTSPGTVAAAGISTLNGAVVTSAGTGGFTTQQNARGLYEACRSSALLNFAAWSWLWIPALTNVNGVSQFLAVQATAGPNWKSVGINITSIQKGTYCGANIVQGSIIPMSRPLTIDPVNGWIYYMQTNARGIAVAIKTNASFYTPVHACYGTNAEVLAQVPVSDLAAYGLPCTIQELMVGTDDVVANANGFAYPTHWWGVSNPMSVNMALNMEYNTYGPCANNMSHHLVSGQIQDICSWSGANGSTYGSTSYYSFASGEGLFQGADSGATIYTVHRCGVYPQLLWAFCQNQASTSYARSTGACMSNLDWYKFTGTAPTNEQLLIGPCEDFQTTVNALGTTSDATITVVDTTGFPATGWIYMDGEIIKYTGKTGTSFTGCTRAQYTTTALKPLVGLKVFVCGWWVFIVQGLVFGGYQTPV